MQVDVFVICRRSRSAKLYTLVRADQSFSVLLNEQETFTGKCVLMSTFHNRLIVRCTINYIYYLSILFIRKKHRTQAL